MNADVDAVIAALRVVLDEAQSSTNPHWQVSSCNRWIALLPGAWIGRWRHLTLRPLPYCSYVHRHDFVAHVRATLAYLETNGGTIGPVRTWLLPPRRPLSRLPPGSSDQDHRHNVQARRRKELPGALTTPLAAGRALK